MNTDKNLRFAFAVNDDRQFEKRHFGDADQYLIYEYHDDGMHFIAAEKNTFRNLDEEQEHGSKRKGKAIIDFLKSKGVNVLVSMQFGRNIKLVNQHFIPVIISAETPDEVLNILQHHIRWIEEEWERKRANHMLFIIKAGILKTAVD